MSKKILFVDDDNLVLNALERTFLYSDYETHFANSVTDALNLLKQTDVDMVISDIRMAPVNGYVFLKKVRELYPETLRIVLSAYADKPMIIKTICDGIAKIYMLKPWDNAKFVTEITHIFEMYDNLHSLNILQNTTYGIQIPLLPQVYKEVLKAIEQDYSFKEITAIIEQDPVCAAKVLALAGSSFYGLNVNSVHQALVFLGVRAVKDLLIVSEVFSDTDSNNEIGKSRRNLLKQANICSSLLNGFHQHLYNKRIIEEYSTAGLLLDIGRISMLNTYKGNYSAIIEKTTCSNTISDSEITAFGISHNQVGASVADWWNLPATVVEACLFHHDPLNSKVTPVNIMALIHAADFFSWKYFGVNKNVSISSDVLDILDTTMDQLDKWATTILQTKS